MSSIRSEHRAPRRSPLHPFLDLLPDGVADETLANARRRQYERGDVVIREGEAGNALFLVLSGHLGVRTSTAYGDEAVIAIRASGEVVGEMAFVEDRPTTRSATVVALTPAETLAIHERRFRQLLDTVPGVARWLAHVLATRLREASGQLRDAHYVSADVRVLRRLVDAVEVFGPEVLLTQDDLAAMAGTSRPTVNRALADAQSRGLLEVHRGRLHVRDDAGLRARAGIVSDDWT